MDRLLAAMLAALVMTVVIGSFIGLCLLNVWAFENHRVWVKVAVIVFDAFILFTFLALMEDDY